LQKRIEGDLKPDRHVIVIEDLVSTGGSSLSTVEALRDEGKAVVTDVAAIFTYEFGEAHERAVEAGLHFHPLTTITTLLEVAREQGRIDEGEAKEVARFVRDPKSWRA